MNQFQRQPRKASLSTSHRFTREEAQVLFRHDPNHQRETTIRVAGHAHDPDDFFELMGYLALPSDDPSLLPIQQLLKARPR